MHHYKSKKIKRFIMSNSNTQNTNTQNANKNFVTAVSEILVSKDGKKFAPEGSGVATSLQELDHKADIITNILKQRGKLGTNYTKVLDNLLTHYELFLTGASEYMVKNNQDLSSIRQVSALFEEKFENYPEIKQKVAKLSDKVVGNVMASNAQTMYSEIMSELGQATQFIKSKNVLGPRLTAEFENKFNNLNAEFKQNPNMAPEKMLGHLEEMNNWAKSKHQEVSNKSGWKSFCGVISCACKVVKSFITRDKEGVKNHIMDMKQNAKELTSSKEIKSELGNLKGKTGTFVEKLQASRAAGPSQSRQV